MSTGAPGLVVPTPWYPLPYNRMAGSFVAEHARLAQALVPDMEVVHGLEWPGGTAEVVAGLRPSFDALLRRASLRVPGGPVPLTRVPVMITGGMSVPERAEALVADVRTALGRIEAPLVHGHVGYLGGLLAARLADPSSKVFATEHSSGLGAVLDDPAGLAQYAEVLERCERVFCVSQVLREQLVEALPEHAGKVEVLHNAVDFDAIPVRPTPPASLDRAVFVGNLIESKGVVRLLAAFAVIARDNPRALLTLYGDGPLRAELEQRAVEAGVRERVDFRGVVPHATLLQELRTHDLLFAPSTRETFHLAVPEGVAAGLPVVVTRSGGPQEALAGVEDRVGRFVDVEDSPDALVDAYRDLSTRLDELDLPGARAELAARYGTQAVTSRLAEAYGEVPRASSTPRPAPQDAPRRVVLLAGSGNRRYDVHAALDALAQGPVEVVLASSDEELVGRARESGVPVAPMAEVSRMTAPARSWKGRLRRRLTGIRGNPLGLRGRRGEVLVVTDCHAAAAGLALAERVPRATLACQAPEVPR